MIKNLGRIDRTVRAGIGVLLIVLIASGAVSGAMVWVLAAVGVIMLATASIRWCPLYAALRLSTDREVHRV